MMTPGFLPDPEMRRWLGGIEPAWTLLEMESMNGLRREPSKDNRALCLANDLTDVEIAASAVTRNALILLRRAADFLRLTIPDAALATPPGGGDEIGIVLNRLSPIIHQVLIEVIRTDERCLAEDDGGADVLAALSVRARQAESVLRDRARPP